MFPSISHIKNEKTGKWETVKQHKKWCSYCKNTPEGYMSPHGQICKGGKTK